MENTEQTPIEQAILKVALTDLIKDTYSSIDYYSKKVNEQKMLLEIYTNQLTQLN